ncbi:MAG: hypothetical protein IJH70_16465 [Oscillospiraceae bacterium]|nr:hypothetical protein [Oscillospiraceae bacterium]
MKRALRVIGTIMVLFVVCFALCSCGNSNVKRVEDLIDAIGEVTIDRYKIIQLAKDSYNELPEDDKSKVKNYDILEAAILEYTKLSVLGSWCYEVHSYPDAFELKQDGSTSESGVMWSVAGENNIRLYYYSEPSYYYNLDIIYEDGYQKLSSSPGFDGDEDEYEDYDREYGGKAILVRYEDYYPARAKKYLTISLNNETVDPYLGELRCIGINDGISFFQFTSKLYEQGYIYLGCSEDFKLHGDQYCNGIKSEWRDPFGEMKALDIIPRTADEIMTANNVYAHGSIYYVAEDHVAVNYLSPVLDDDDESADVVAIRTIELKTGEIFKDTIYWPWNSDYEMYKY